MMTEIDGIITARHGDKTYKLTLGMSGIATLQKEYGQDLAPLVSVVDDGKMPDFGVLVRVTQIALERFHPDADRYLADDLLRADLSIAPEIIKGAFPSEALPEDAPRGNVEKPRPKKPKTLRRG